MKSSNNPAALMFYARHWDLMAWLEDNWLSDNAEKMLGQARKIGFPEDAVKKLSQLTLADGEFSRHFDEIVSEAALQARDLARLATEEMQAILRRAGCQCGEPKRTNARSDWGNQISVRPKDRRNDAPLWVGATVDCVLNSQGVREPRLYSWLWMKSGRGGVSTARHDSQLAHVLRSDHGMDEAIEEGWSNSIVLGSGALLEFCSESLELDAASLIATACSGRIGEITHDHVKKLYELAEG
ncbi:MAG: hypothetical protein VX836_04730 [Pseudomonadota bacterium]|nr:hypothetical protein [Pseudomonadota bacterium]